MRFTDNRFRAAVVGAAVMGLALAGCGGSSSGGSNKGGKGGGTSTLADCSSSPNSCNTGSVAKGSGTLVAALEKNIDGWSELNLNDNVQDFIYALNGIYPWVTIANPDGSYSFNKDVVSDYKLTSQSPETLQIVVNPKATWDDGTPVTTDDFRYVFSIQNPKACPKCQPASTAGFDQVDTATASADKRTLTIKFAKTYPDWPGLYANLLPAHIAAKHEGVDVETLLKSPSKLEDSFDNYFVKTVPTWSMGPYKIQSWTPNQKLVEVPNPKWYGSEGPNLTQLVFEYVKDASQEPPALQNNEVQVIFPQPQVDLVQQVKNIPNVESSIESGLTWEHFDLNFKNPVIGKYKAFRQALYTAVDRNALIQKTVAQFDKDVKPLNNHVFVPGQPGYTDNSAAGNKQGTGDITAAKALLTQAGFKGVGSKLVAPDGTAVPALRIRYTSGNAIRQQECELFKEAVAQLGVTVNIVPTDSLGGTLGKGDFDIIVFAWVDTPFPVSGAYGIYTTGQGNNFNKYSNKQVDGLLAQAAGSVDLTKDRETLNQADKLIWDDAVELPLYQKPVFLALYKNYKNIRPNSASIGYSYNIQQWGVSAKSS